MNRMHFRHLAFLTILFLLTGTALSMNAEGFYTTSTVNLRGQRFTAYKIEKKETLYALSREMGVNYDTLVLWNQGISGDVPKGYILYMPDGTPEIVPVVKKEETITYKVKYGDTLFSLARKFNTTVQDIISVNPQLRSSVLTAGSDIKICSQSAQKTLKATKEMRPGIVSFRYYQVKKDESPEGVAAQNGIEVALLRDANPGITFKNRAKLAIPVMGNVEFITYVQNTDSRENSAEGQQAIFDSIAETNARPVVNVAILLANPQANKDIDFSRGFLTAVKEFGEVSRDIDVKFVNGSIEAPDLILNPVLHNADIIFTTYDGFIPTVLTDYAANNNKTLINAFTVRDTLYRQNPVLINLLSSPEEFNSQSAAYLLENYGDRYFIFLGDPLKANDQIATKIMNVLDTDNFEVVEKLENVVPHPSKSMIIYSFANNKNDIKTHLEAVSAWIESNPGVDVFTLGRPSWIVSADGYAESMKKAHTMFPSRFHFAERDPESQQFLKKYHDFFKADPVRSYPAYSVMGYDAAWNFLQPGEPHSNLQMPFRLMRYPGGGEYNCAAMLLQFMPGVPVRKFDIVPLQQPADVAPGN